MFTIIIANYNRTDELKRCLDSIGIAFDGFSEPEVIVVEDASDHILSDKRITHHLMLDKNGGPVRARLAGVKVAKFEYILLLDSDDSLLESSVYTIKNVMEKNPGFDSYGFTFSGGERLVDFEIKSIDDYCDFVSDKDRTSDYIMLIKKDVLSKYVASHSFRISEIWLFSEMFIRHTGFYSGESIFNYHQDAKEQLSKKRLFSFKIDRYERRSVSKSAEFFIAFIAKYKSESFIFAWRKRLIKESFLYFNLKALYRILCLK